MESNNFVQLTGNLGADYQVIDLKNGRKMYRIALAVSSAYYDGAGILVKKTNWFNGSYFWQCMDCGKKHDYEYFKSLSKED